MAAAANHSRPIFVVRKWPSVRAIGMILKKSLQSATVVSKRHRHQINTTRWALSSDALMVLIVLTPHWQILKRLRQELMNTIEVTHCTDPLTVFPAEIMEMILSYLEFKEVVLVDAEYLVLGATDIVQGYVSGFQKPGEPT